MHRTLIGRVRCARVRISGMIIVQKGSEFMQRFEKCRRFVWVTVRNIDLLWHRFLLLLLSFDVLLTELTQYSVIWAVVEPTQRLPFHNHPKYDFIYRLSLHIAWHFEWLLNTHVTWASIKVTHVYWTAAVPISSEGFNRIRTLLIAFISIQIPFVLYEP